MVFRTAEPESPQLTTRRSFYVRAINAMWAAITAALAAPALIYLLLPPKLRKESEWVEAGDISKLQPNVPTELVFRKNRIDGWRVISEKTTTWAVKLGGNEVVAFGPQCTHLGCAYHWEAEKSQFICPCHTSIFSIDGKVVSGPAPRPLDRFETKIENNKLLLGALHETVEPGE